MTESTYCTATGCRTHGHPTRTDNNATLCRRCEDQTRNWLNTIPELYALLPTFIEHGTTDRNPESKSTKASNAPAPMRLEITDMLDTRRYRKWQGLSTTDDRRGVLGTLIGWANEIRDGRNLTTPEPQTVTIACQLINTQMLWAIEQDFAGTMHAEIKTLHRQLSDAIGDYRPRPVGTCYYVPDDADAECGGPLLANKSGGVRCPRCGSTWDAGELRLLGLALGQGKDPADIDQESA